MKEKILAQLQLKFAGVSKKALGLIADKLAKKVTAEDGIEQAITDFDNAVSIKEFADDLQREGDTRVGDAKKQWEKENPKPADPPKPTDPPKPGDEIPAWAKALTDQISTLTREKAQSSIRTQAEALLKDVPVKFWGGRAIPEKEEELQTFVESVTKDYGDFKQGLIDEGLMSATPPAGGGGGGTTIPEKQLDAEIKEWADKGKAAEPKK